MIVNFNDGQCQTISSQKLFGLCDDPAPAKNPAYIDEQIGAKWIAIVDNEDRKTVTFTAIDNCIPIAREDGKGAKRCDGMLTFEDTVIFVELKERSGSAWVKDAEEQLRVTIEVFKNQSAELTFKTKKAYIANSEHPKFKSSQQIRMEKFLDETGYTLRIENRIKLNNYYSSLESRS